MVAPRTAHLILWTERCPAAPPPVPAATDRQVAAYLAEVCAELRELARERPRLRFIAYLVDMARLEAERMGKG